MLIKSVFLTFLFSLILFPGTALAETQYKILQKDDISYARVKRVRVTIRILNNEVPTEQGLKDVARDVLKKQGKRWAQVSVFILVKDMPDGVAYAAVHFKGDRMDNFILNEWALEMHEGQKANSEAKGDKTPSASRNQQDHIGWKPGNRYFLNKETPLMPEPNPKNIYKAIGEMKKLQPNDVVDLLSVELVRGHYWYEVIATNANGEDLGYGWINSTALIGQ
jgi:hypothetical protein